MGTSLEVLFTPAEFDALSQRDLGETVCVVFDVLRATTSMVVALNQGATAILPVSEISEAVSLRAHRPDWLLAGERDGVRIGASLTGGVDFDLGNSPREFTRDRVFGRTIVMTTTNGTRALRAAQPAKEVLVASLVNLGATAQFLGQEKPAQLLLVCSGTLDQAAYEDVLAAGALCDRLWPRYAGGTVADSGQMARSLFHLERHDLASALARSRNGRRLLARPDLADDVAFCARTDTVGLVVKLDRTGAVRTAG